MAGGTENRTSGESAGALVLGDGGWGTAIAITLGHGSNRIGLWSHDPAYAREMAGARRNPRFLPAAEIPPQIAIDSDIRNLAPGAAAIFSVIPTRYLRAVIRRLAPDIPPAALLVSCTKGIERETLKLPSEIIEEELGRRRIAVLSGPSHAEEVCRRLPTTVVAAAREIEDARATQRLFASTWVRVYTGRDPRGVELGGAVKNVIAIAAGISDGLGFGDNSRAAIVTRGAAEIARMGAALGARPETFAGLSGIGDLITTCTSGHSRNRSVGFRIGRGEKLEEILASTPMIAEGVETCRSVHDLAHRLGVEMPITREVHAVLYEGKPPRDGVASLMSRSAKEEVEGP